MFCYKGDMNKIISVHKRALRTIQNNFTALYKDLLITEKTCQIHQKHIQILMTEIYKSFHRLNPTIINELFQLKDRHYNTRNIYVLKLPPARTSFLGTNSLIFKGSLIWNRLPNEIKASPNFTGFLRKIKNFQLDFKCNCCACT